MFDHDKTGTAQSRGLQNTAGPLIGVVHAVVQVIAVELRRFASRLKTSIIDVPKIRQKQTELDDAQQKNERHRERQEKLHGDHSATAIPRSPGFRRCLLHENPDSEDNPAMSAAISVPFDGPVSRFSDVTRHFCGNSTAIAGRADANHETRSVKTVRANSPRCCISATRSPLRVVLQQRLPVAAAMRYR